jgi:RNA polymerase sigma-70 factor (ECF subfamily)
MSLGASFDQIIAGAKAGAPWALEALYLDTHPRLLRYLTAQAPDVGEDLASDTWLGVAGALPAFDGQENDFRALVFTVAKRRLLDHRRRASRRRTDPVDPELLAGLGPNGDAEDDALDRVSTGWALNQIAALPPDQREVILLRVVADLAVDEVAAIVGKRPGAVRALQLRGLRRLARHIPKEAVTR